MSTVSSSILPKSPATYAAPETCLFASHWEAGPKAVLESMAGGASLVFTRKSQASEIVRDELNGFLMESEDTENLAGKILAIFEYDFNGVQFRDWGSLQRID